MRGKMRKANRLTAIPLGKTQPTSSGQPPPVRPDRRPVMSGRTPKGRLDLPWAVARGAEVLPRVAGRSATAATAARARARLGLGLDFLSLSERLRLEVGQTLLHPLDEKTCCQSDRQPGGRQARRLQPWRKSPRPLA